MLKNKDLTVGISATHVPLFNKTILCTQTRDIARMVKCLHSWTTQTDSCNRHRVKWATWQFDIHVWLLQQSQTWMPKYLSGSSIPRQRTHFLTAALGTGGLSFIFIKIGPLLHGNTGKMWEEFPVEKEKTAENKCSQIRDLIGSTLHFPPLIANPLS